MEAKKGKSIVKLFMNGTKHLEHILGYSERFYYGYTTG